MKIAFQHNIKIKTKQIAENWQNSDQVSEKEKDHRR